MNKYASAAIRDWEDEGGSIPALEKIKNIDEAAKESTCLKRITVCVIFDQHGHILSCESNRCSPGNGTCERLNIVQNKQEYSEKSCNWTHAEIMAIRALPENARPFKAILYGHNFLCESCEKSLKNSGVKEIEIVSSGLGTGLRHQPQTASEG